MAELEAVAVMAAADGNWVTLRTRRAYPNQ